MIRDAVRALKQRRHEDALKLKGLRSHVKAGVEALKRGDFLEIDEIELDRYFEELRSTSEDVG